MSYYWFNKQEILQKAINVRIVIYYAYSQWSLK